MCIWFSNLFKIRMLSVLIIASLGLSSCAKKISPLYKYNTYLDDFNNYVINDSIEFIHRTYGNVDFMKSKEALSGFIDTNFPGISAVLLAGKSRDTINTKYAILVNPRNPKKLTSNYEHIRDTIINDDHYYFVSNRKWTLQGWDLKNPMLDAFYVGKDYRNYIPGLFDFQSGCSQTITFLRCLKGYGDYPKLDNSIGDMKLQLQLTYASFLGNNYKYAQLLEQYNNKKDLSRELSELKKRGINGWEEVRKEISILSSDRQIVMFSENHFKPNHRKVVTLLLPELRKQGFKYLALEALSIGSDTLLNSGSNVLNTMGFYTREQNFIELIETAQKLGFTLVSYDEFKENRELVQAENLLAKTIKQDPKAKVLVLAGFGHINEGPNSRGDKMMSGHLKAISGIDPLTISQTAFSKHSFKELSDVMLIKSEDVPSEYRKKTDYTLVHPDVYTNFEIQDRNFHYQNTYDFDIQLDIYRTEDLEHAYSHVKMPPMKSVLVPANGTVKLYLREGKSYKYFTTDENALTQDEGLIRL